MSGFFAFITFFNIFNLIYAYYNLKETNVMKIKEYKETSRSEITKDW